MYLRHQAYTFLLLPRMYCIFGFIHVFACSLSLRCMLEDVIHTINQTTISLATLSCINKFVCKSQLIPPTKVYKMYSKFFISTKSKIYIPSTSKIYQNFQIWHIYLPVGNTDDDAAAGMRLEQPSFIKTRKTLALSTRNLIR